MVGTDGSWRISLWRVRVVKTVQGVWRWRWRMACRRRRELRRSRHSRVTTILLMILHVVVDAVGAVVTVKSVGRDLVVARCRDGLCELSTVRCKITAWMNSISRGIRHSVWQRCRLAGWLSWSDRFCWLRPWYRSWRGSRFLKNKHVYNGFVWFQVRIVILKNSIILPGWHRGMRSPVDHSWAILRVVHRCIVMCIGVSSHLRTICRWNTQRGQGLCQGINTLRRRIRRRRTIVVNWYYFPLLRIPTRVRNEGIKNQLELIMTNNISIEWYVTIEPSPNWMIQKFYL